MTRNGRHLVLLAHRDERGDLFRHPDDPLDGDVRHVDHADQVARLGRASLEKKFFASSPYCPLYLGQFFSRSYPCKIVS